jgi:hypothetical protein
MCVEHDARAGIALLGDDGTQAVVSDAVGEGMHPFNHDFSNRFLKTRRARGFSELL